MTGNIKNDKSSSAPTPPFCNGSEPTCTDDTYAMPTIIDIGNAFAFAKTQTDYLLCKKPNKFCNNKSSCLEWKTHKINQTWSNEIPFKPSNLQSKDKNKFPWESWSDDGWKSAGHCHIIDENFCNKISKVPYKCTGTDCKVDLNTQYFEWQTETCSTDKEGGAINCVSNDKCKDVSICSDGNSCNANAGICTCTKENQCNGNLKCVDGLCQKSSDTPGRCVLGNAYLRTWCEEPISRCDDTFATDMCKGDAQNPGITDVPPFYYDTKNGKCYMTKEYCDRYGAGGTVDASTGKDIEQCSTETPCGTGVCHGGYCVDENTKCSDLPKWAKFTIGDTLFTLFSGHCDFGSDSYDTRESAKKHIESIRNKLNESSHKIEKLIDPRFIEKKQLIMKNYVDGLDLYMIDWKNGITPQKDIGFDSSQIKSKYPELLKMKDNKEYITITKNHAKINNQLKRIYAILSTGKGLSDMLVGMVLVQKDVKKKKNQ